MELRQVRYFVVLAELLNFSETAKVLYITQPTLSQQINELEKELGVKLLDRTKRRVALTEDGERFLIGAKDLLGRSDALARDMTEGRSLKKALRILVSSHALDYPAVFHSLVRAGIKTRETGLVADLIFDVADDVSRDSLKLIPSLDGVIYCAMPAPDPPAARELPLLEDELVLVAARSLGENLRLEELLAEYPIFFVNIKEKGMKLPFRSMHSFLADSSIRILQNMTEAVLEVSMGQGSLLMPAGTVDRTFRGTDVTIRRFPREALDISASVMCAWREEADGIMAEFLEYCRNGSEA